MIIKLFLEMEMDTSTSPEGSYTENLIGTLLAIFGNVLVSISLSIQKYSHVKLAGNKDLRAFYGTKTWWCGFVFTCIGEGANFASYAFAPLALVAPLNAVSILTSSILGFIFLREKLKPKDFMKRYALAFLGCILTIGGTYLFVSFGPNSHEKITAENVVIHIVGWPVLLYLFLGIIAFCLLLFFHKKRHINYLIIILLLVALLGSITVITVKAVSGMLLLTIKGSMQLDYPIFSVMFVCMVASVVFQAGFLAQACKLHEPCLIAGVNYILSTVLAVVAGAVFYLEFKNEDVLHICMFLLGTSLCLLGVFFITKTKKTTKSFEPYVTMNMANGVPTIHDKDFNSAFSYGSLVNSDGAAPFPLPNNLKQSPDSFRSTNSSDGHSDFKKD
ncbi:NIPA-like protein 3 [Antennarius striatus]|uniref:NIPA-like protein 3 n=1 Tax=Antennarius striatus TaxID=241820 RepID=UPI0035B4CC6F